MSCGRRGRDAEATARDVVANFPLHVGNRTTFRFINTQHIPWFEGNEVRLQQLQSKTGLFRYLQHKKEHPEARLHAFDTDFTKYVSQNIVNLPTGGYFAVRPNPNTHNTRCAVALSEPAKRVFYAGSK